MNISQPPYYHGTSKQAAENIVKNGIIQNKLQSRDRGFFGKGFYVAATKDIAQNNSSSHSNPAILKIEFSNNISILYAGETITSGSIKPLSNPSWYQNYINWSLKKVEDAAVWEFSNKTEDEIISMAKKERTPISSFFNRPKWYTDVIEYSKETDYDIIY